MNEKPSREDILRAGQLIVPGDLILNNGSKLVATGYVASCVDEIYEKGNDVTMNGAIMNIKGNVIVGGTIIFLDTESSVSVEG